MRIISEALGPGGQIPQKYTRDGDNVSPPLGWHDVPPGTRELAVVFEKTTPSTREPTPNWLLYKVPPDLEQLPENLGHKAEPEHHVRMCHGRNALGNHGYDGPLGSVGRNEHYRVRLLALDQSLDLPPGVSQDELERATKGHVLDEAAVELVYTRPRP